MSLQCSPETCLRYTAFDMTRRTYDFLLISLFITIHVQPNYQYCTESLIGFSVRRNIIWVRNHLSETEQKLKDSFAHSSMQIKGIGYKTAEKAKVTLAVFRWASGLHRHYANKMLPPMLCMVDGSSYCDRWHGTRWHAGGTRYAGCGGTRWNTIKFYRTVQYWNDSTKLFLNITISNIFWYLLTLTPFCTLYLLYIYEGSPRKFSRDFGDLLGILSQSARAAFDFKSFGFNSFLY